MTTTTCADHVPHAFNSTIQVINPHFIQQAKAKQKNYLDLKRTKCSRTIGMLFCVAIYSTYRPWRPVYKLNFRQKKPISVFIPYNYDTRDIQNIYHSKTRQQLNIGLYECIKCSYVVCVP